MAGKRITFAPATASLWFSLWHSISLECEKNQGSTEKLETFLTKKILLGAGASFLISVFVPSLLFSGQHAMPLVLEQSKNRLFMKKAETNLQ
ncbi:hypothetical protein AALA52_04865 [Lactococcus ileimucosae]|uniref:Uncharacterized protein n=1 Tax=Lactococcus ileimucosae TaxID=2941329 RepID=A0ABV4D1Z8_9LACT